MTNYCHLSYENRKNIEDGLDNKKSINPYCNLVQKIVFFCADELIVLYKRMQSFVQGNKKRKGFPLLLTIMYLKNN